MQTVGREQPKITLRQDVEEIKSEHRTKADGLEKGDGKGEKQERKEEVKRGVCRDVSGGKVSQEMRT